jgi:hypothetical protein
MHKTQGASTGYIYCMSLLLLLLLLCVVMPARGALEVVSTEPPSVQEAAALCVIACLENDEEGGCFIVCARLSLLMQLQTRFLLFFVLDVFLFKLKKLQADRLSTNTAL